MTLSGNTIRELVIRASAGTGKTYKLSGEFVRRMLDGAAPDQILATTFTRKAAGEILDRILLKLAEASLEPEKLAELAEQIESPGLTVDSCNHQLARLTRHLHRLRICTLDSFFSQLASSCSLELGLSPGWSIADERTQDELTHQAIERLLQTASTTAVVDLLHLLSKGSSTRSVTQLIQETVTELHRVYRSSPEEAWNRFPAIQTPTDAEVEQIIDDLRQTDVEHKAIRNALFKLGDLIQAEDWQSFFKGKLPVTVLTGENLMYGKPLPDHVVAVVERANELARTAIISQVRGQSKATHDLLERYDSCYRELLAEKGILKFDDVAHALATESPESGNVSLSYRLDAELHHLFLDEFQDTSLDQWDILRPFVEAIDADQSRTLFGVGDVKQAIYGWRGGVAEVFDALEQGLSECRTEPLDRSWRSSQVIIDAVNRVFLLPSNHPDLKRATQGVLQWCGQFNEHETARTELEGEVSLKVAPEPPAEKPSKSDWTESVLQFTASEVETIHKQVPDASIGILTRRNSAVSRIITLLRERGISASEEGGAAITDSPAVQLILSILEFADHPDHRIAHFHAAQSPLAEQLGITPGDEPVQRHAASARIRAALLHHGYDGLIDIWFHVLEEHVTTADRRRLRQLLTIASEYQGSASLRPADFVKFVEIKRIAEPTGDPVRAMTIHQAKGLQFDIVFLCELDGDLVKSQPSYIVGRKTPTSPPLLVSRAIRLAEQDLFPASFQEAAESGVDQNVREQLSVLYVAMTRAIHALHMIIPQIKPAAVSAAAVVTAGLAPDQPILAGNTLYSEGDPDWYKGPRTPREFGGGDEETCPTISFRVRDPLRLRERDRKTPSGLEGQNLVKVDHLVARPSTHALDRGTLMHGWLEQVEWLNHDVPAAFQLPEACRMLPAEQISEWESEFRQFLQGPRIQRLLSVEEYADGLESLMLPEAIDCPGKWQLEVRNEERFLIAMDDGIFNGSIDRLVLIRDGKNLVAADVIDFKTDNVDATTREERTGHYSAQLNAYRSAVTAAFGLPPSRISTRLFFLALDEVIAVDAEA